METTKSNYNDRYKGETTKPNYSGREKSPRPYVEIRVAKLERKVREQYRMILDLKEEIKRLKT